MCTSLSMNNNFIRSIVCTYWKARKEIFTSRIQSYRYQFNQSGYKLFVQLILYNVINLLISIESNRTAFQHTIQPAEIEMIKWTGNQAYREYSNIELKVCYPEWNGEGGEEGIEIKFSRCRPREFPWTNEARIRFAVSLFKRNSSPRVTRSFEGGGER